MSIIGICGISGSGKTTLTQALSQALEQAPTIFWDDFASISEYPEDYVEWYRSSKDYAAWKTPLLTQLLESIKSGKTTTCPATDKIIKPSKWLLYDAPLGRNHVETGRWIDFLVFLDTPADIALARRLQRDHLNKDPFDEAAMQQELETYIHAARPLFLDTDSLKADADLVLIDASGAKIVGEGEWKVKIHGKSKRRQWVKIHIALDPETQEVVAESTTSPSVKDGKMVETLLNKIEGALETVIADGAYDEQSARKSIREKGAKALVPPPCNARLHGTDLERYDAIKDIRSLGGDKVAKSLWGKLTGYSIRALVETAFSRMKRLFGERLFSKKAPTQMVENRLRCLLLNKMQRLKRVAAASALG